MTIAIISDIHANLEALQQVLEYLKENKIEKIYCLGDIVGYGPNPNECIELVRQNCEAVLMGNHDYAAIGIGDIQNFNEYAKLSTFWTREKLTVENSEFIKSWPFVFELDSSFLVHASPKNPSNWDYVLSVNDAQKHLKTFHQKVCFIGHSHVPVIFSKSDYYRQTEFTLKKSQKYLVNVGSVGQPRDGDPRTCFVTYDDEKNEINYIRLDYEIQKTYNKIIKAGLPVFLAERLLKGY
jgi:predicted phosphodiesterase